MCPTIENMSASETTDLTKVPDCPHDHVKDLGIEELRELVKNQTDDGLKIVKFLVKAMEGDLPNYEPHHELEAAKILSNLGSDEAAEYVRSYGARRKRASTKGERTSAKNLATDYGQSDPYLVIEPVISEHRPLHPQVRPPAGRPSSSGSSRSWRPMRTHTSRTTISRQPKSYSTGAGRCPTPSSAPGSAVTTSRPSTSTVKSPRNPGTAIIHRRRWTTRLLQPPRIPKTRTLTRAPLKRTRPRSPWPSKTPLKPALSLLANPIILSLSKGRKTPRRASPT